MQSLQLELKSGSKDSVDNILALLTKLRQDEVDAQATDDANWTTESAECLEVETDLQADIDSANSQTDENNNNIELLQTSVSNDQASLDEASANLVTTANALHNLQDARVTEHATYLENTASISATITALQQGKEILNALVVEAGESFIQKKGNANVFAQFNSHITDAKLKKGKFHGFVLALLSMLSKDIVADQALVSQVIGLIDGLIDQLSDELTTLASNEKTAQEIFETQETNLSSEIGILNSLIADLQSEITSTNAQVLDLQSDNSNLFVTITNKTQEREDRLTTCSDDLAAYTATQEQRFF